MEKEFEALDKLEECANGMKDLPKSNWIDLAENEAELDLKIMDWVEAIKFELFKGKQALTELKAIKEAKPSEAMEELENYLFNEWKQNHVNVGCDYKLEAELAKQLNNLKAIKNALLEFKRLDLLLKLPSEQSSSHFTYKDKNLVCMQSTKYSKLMNAFLEYEETQELEKVLEIIKKKDVDIKKLKYRLRVKDDDVYLHYKYDLIMTREEFDLLKRWSEK